MSLPPQMQIVFGGAGDHGQQNYMPAHVPTAVLAAPEPPKLSIQSQGQMGGVVGGVGGASAQASVVQTVGQIDANVIKARREQAAAARMNANRARFLQKAAAHAVKLRQAWERAEAPLAGAAAEAAAARARFLQKAAAHAVKLRPAWERAEAYAAEAEAAAEATEAGAAAEAAEAGAAADAAEAGAAAEAADAAKQGHDRLTI
jgi:hypothetical protein